MPNPTTTNKSLAKKVQQGKATAANMTAGVATQQGIGFTDDNAPCADSGQHCTRMTGRDDLPLAVSSMGRLCRLGYRREPRVMLAAFVLSQLAALPDALPALWFMLLGQGVLERRTTWCSPRPSAWAYPTATWFLGTVST